MKTAKKVLCLMLCVALMAGTFCTAASAKTYLGGEISDSDFLYVAVGDSASMGYQMDDYYDHFQHNWDERTQSEAEPSSSYSVYDRMSKYLENTVKVENLVCKDLSMTGMRSLELRSFLDESYYEAHKGEIKSFNDGGSFWGYHMDEYLTRHAGNGSGRHGYGDYKLLHDTYTNFLYNADLITYDLTMNDFGTYLGQRFTEGDKDCFKVETLANLLAENEYVGLAENVEALRGALEQILAKVELPLDAATVEGYLDMFLYCYANFAINFSKNMDFIYTNNPDVQLIVIGPFNAMEGVTFTIGDIELDVGLVWKALNEAITAWVCAVDSHKNLYKFADLSGGCETCITAIANGDWDQYDTMTYLYLGELMGKNLDNVFDLYAPNPDLGNFSVMQYVFQEEAAKGTFNGMSDEDKVAFACKNSEALVTAVSRLDPEMGGNLAYLFGMIDLLKANMTKIANVPVIPIMDVLAGMSDGSMNDMVERAVTDFDKASEADIGMAHAAIRLVLSYALGSHPDAKGYDQKIAAVIKAYENNYAADGTYMARVVEKTVDSSIGFIGHLFNVIMGRESLADLKAYVLSIFQPMLKVFDLAGSFGLC